MKLKLVELLLYSKLDGALINPHTLALAWNDLVDAVTDLVKLLLRFVLDDVE